MINSALVIKNKTTKRLLFIKCHLKINAVVAETTITKNALCIIPNAISKKLFFLKDSYKPWELRDAHQAKIKAKNDGSPDQSATLAN